MALIQLYTAADATALQGTDTLDAFQSYGFYLARFDCVVYFSNAALGGQYKIYRDGTAVRVGYVGILPGQKGFDVNLDLVISFADLVGPRHFYDDPISLHYDPSRDSTLTYTGVITLGSGGGQAVVWKEAYYQPSGANILKKNLATGATLQTIVLTGAITFLADRIAITPGGLLVAIDFDNGVSGCVRFYDLLTDENLYTSTFARSKFAFVDTTHEQIWSIGLSDSKMRVYQFQPAPSTFTPFTVGSNRKRYREDDITTTLKGADGELITNWPVQWELNQAVPEGQLESLYTVTDEDGVTTNRFFGPGMDDFLGQSTQIKAWTAY